MTCVYILKQVAEGDSLESTFEAESLDDMLAYYERFLRGCGFVFSGHLDIREDP